MKTSVLMLLGCLLATASLAQTTTRREIWEWKDANGVTHYSDYPAPGARKIIITGSTATAAPTPPPPPPPAAASGTRRANTVQYANLEIWSPENGGSFFGADLLVVVRIRSEPELSQGDRLFTYLDGRLLPGENALEHRLTDVPRGAHSLISVIVDAMGIEKIRSEPVVFHIRQPTTVDNPQNRGPTLRPPPPTPGG